MRLAGPRHPSDHGTFPLRCHENGTASGSCRSRHGSRWRIRWFDEHGRRKSAVYDDYKRAQLEERKRKIEVEEGRRGLRTAAPSEKTFDELCDYWLEKRAPRKRSGKADKSIIPNTLGRCRNVGARWSAPRENQGAAQVTVTCPPSTLHAQPTDPTQLQSEHPPAKLHIAELPLPEGPPIVIQQICSVVHLLSAHANVSPE